MAANLRRSGEQSSYVVSAWNLRTGAEHRPERAARHRDAWPFTMSGWTDKRIYCVATDISGAEPMVLGAGPGGQVRTWDLRTLRPLWNESPGGV